MPMQHLGKCLGRQTTKEYMTLRVIPAHFINYSITNIQDNSHFIGVSDKINLPTGDII